MDVDVEAFVQAMLVEPAPPLAGGGLVFGQCLDFYPGPDTACVARFPPGGRMEFWCLDELHPDLALIGVNDIRPFGVTLPTPAWYWLLDDLQFPGGFHPYLDLEKKVPLEEVEQTRAQCEEAWRDFARRVETSVVGVIRTMHERVQTHVFVSEATRRVDGDLVKVSFHVVLRVVAYMEDDSSCFVLVPKCVQKQLVHDTEAMLGYGVMDDAVYSRMQQYRTLGSGKCYDSILRVHLPEGPHDVAYHCPLPNDAGGASYWYAPVAEWARVVQIAPRAMPLGAAMMRGTRRAPRDLFTLNQDMWLERAATTRYQEATGHRVMLVRGSERDLPSFGLGRGDLATVFHVDVPRGDVFQRLAALLPVDRRIGGPGSGTHPTYFALLCLASRLQARAEWIAYARDNIPITRVARQHGSVEDTWAFEYDQQRARTLARRGAGQACTGIGAWIRLLHEAGISPEETNRAIHGTAPQPGVVDADVPCCTQRLLVICTEGANHVYSVQRMCLDCNEIRTLGQVHPDLSYPGLHDIAVLDVVDEVDRLNEMTRELTIVPGAGGQTRMDAERLLLFLCSPCGMGKTLAAQQMILHTTTHSNSVVVVVVLITCALVDFWSCSLRRAAEDAGSPLRICQLHSRSDESLPPSDAVEWPQVIIVTPESMRHVWRSFEKRRDAHALRLALVLDEGSKTLAHFASHTMQRTLQQNLHAFHSMLRSSHTVLVMDADLTLSTISVMHAVVPQHRAVTILNSHAKRAPRTAELTFDPDVLLGAMGRHMKQPAVPGKTLYLFLFSTSKRFADKAAVQLEVAMGPRARIMCYTSDAPLPQDFSETLWSAHERGPGQRPYAACVVIISPVVNAGVSLVPPDHVNAYAFLYAGSGNMMHTAVQMLNRLRSTSTAVVCTESDVHFTPSALREHSLFHNVEEAMQANQANSERCLLVGMPHAKLLLEGFSVEQWAKFRSPFQLLWALLTREGLCVVPLVDDGTLSTLVCLPDTLTPREQKALELEEMLANLDMRAAAAMCPVINKAPTQDLKQLLAFAVTGEDARFFWAGCPYVDAGTSTAPYTGVTQARDIWSRVARMWRACGLDVMGNDVLDLRTVLHWKEVKAAIDTLLGHESQEHLKVNIRVFEEEGFSQLAYRWDLLLKAAMRLRVQVDNKQQPSRSNVIPFYRRAMDMTGVGGYMAARAARANEEHLPITVTFNTARRVLLWRHCGVQHATPMEHISVANLPSRRVSAEGYIPAHCHKMFTSAVCKEYGLKQAVLRIGWLL